MFIVEISLLLNSFPVVHYKLIELCCGLIGKAGHFILLRAHWQFDFELQINCSL